MNKTSRRGFMKSMSAGAAALAASGSALAPTAAEAARARRKPNIIFIMADDLGYGDLGCYGGTKVRTPNIDRLAKEGMRFTDHYSGSTVCAPSRCCLMTGLHTGHTYIRGNKEIQPEGQQPIPADTVTVAKLMKKAGYATGMFGKWGLGGPGSEGVPNKQGFDYFFGPLCQRMAHFYYPTHLWRNEEKVVLEGNDPKKQLGQYSHDLIADEALAFIRRNKDRPFFMYVPFTIPHAELVVPEDSLEEYKGKFKETPYKGDHYGSTPTPKAAFAGMVTRMDRDVGRMLDLLEELGIDDNTLVMFTSDNGPHKEGGHDPNFFDSNGPLRGVKRDLYEGGIRVPMVARWPGTVKAGTVSNHVSAFWDILPTCCDLAGVDAPEKIDGISMANALRGRQLRQKKHDYLYWEFFERGSTQAVRMGDWKAVLFNNDDRLELYNLKDDIHEDHNVADENPKVVAKIRKYLATARTPSEFWKLSKEK